MHHGERAATGKIVSMAEAAALVHDGDHVALGGFACTRNAMGFSHELIRQGRRDLMISGVVLGMDADVLVGAGAVKRAVYGGGSLDRYGAMQCVNRAYETGKIVSEYYSSLALTFRYLAGALGIPFMPTTSLLGSDLLTKLQNETAPDNIREMDDPFTGEHLVLLKALVPDVAVVHVHMADDQGNARILGPRWDNGEAARAARQVVITAEEIVPTAVIRQQPELTTIPGVRVTAVVHAPYGAHPTSMYKCYDHDEGHIRAWVAKARTDAGAADYIQEYVLGSKNHFAYLDKVGGLEKLTSIKADPILGY